MSMYCDLPAYTLRPAPDLLPWISDFWLSLCLPVLLYWAISLVFVYLEVTNKTTQWQSYHTAEEKQVRNTVTKREVFWATVRNQILQTTIAIALSWLQPLPLIGNDQYDIAVWSCRLRRARGSLPPVPALIGIVEKYISTRWRTIGPIWHPDKSEISANGTLDAEFLAGYLMYYVVVPAVQFFVAFVIVDFWQYFGHRLEHEWRWLYKEVHSMHHRLYTPYAWAAFYMHPAELVFLDTVSVTLGCAAAQFSIRQSMWFTALVTFKALCDHAGFEVPGNMIYTIFAGNDAKFHDIHHQPWGFKYNFGIYSTFWDNIFGTLWTDKNLAQQKYRLGAEIAKKRMALTSSGTDVDTSAKID